MPAGVVLAGLGVAAGFGLTSAYEGPGPLAQQRDVVVPHGTSRAVAEALQQAGVLDGTSLFRVFAAVTAWQGPLRSAELSFPAHASVEQVLAVLRTGRPVQHLLTIPEGLTAARLGALVARARGLAGDIELPREGAVLPESYAYAFGATGRSVLSRAERAMDERVMEAWRSRAPDVKLGSPREMLILASLVERETHLPAERAMVARVFLNRLARGMRLQSDPSVVYSESGGDGELPGGLTRDALERVTPYNTYVLPGLPEGPICSPGAASIFAVAHPARSDALYFVADGTGGHVFADSLAEHVRNVQRYRQLTH